MIKYLIIDDEYIAHDIIEGYCNRLPNMELMKHCYDAFEAMDYLYHNSVDLIFLDLNMPQLKGFDFLKTLNQPPKVIVTTAYQEYALEGYELNIVDYLLKPFSFERFMKAVNKAFINPISRPVSTTQKKSNKDRIFLRSDKKHFQVEIAQIQYIEALGNYVKVVTSSEAITFRAKISELLARLPAQDFMQVHKSFAVAIQHIKKIEGNRIFIEEHIIPIGKVYKNNVNQLLK